LDTTERFVVVVENAASEGAIVHTGQYALASALYDTLTTACGRYNLDNVSNGSAVTCCQTSTQANRMPVVNIPDVTAAFAQDCAPPLNCQPTSPGAGYARISYAFPKPATLLGYFDTNPGTNMILGVQAYYKVVAKAAAEPTSSMRGGGYWTVVPNNESKTWVAANCDSDALCNSFFDIDVLGPGMLWDPATQDLFVAISLVFNTNAGGVLDAPAVNDFVNTFVGNHSPRLTQILGPGDVSWGLGVGKRASQLGDQYVSTWQTTGETTITSMRLEVARNQSFSGSCGAGIVCKQVTLTGGGAGAAYTVTQQAEQLKTQLGGPQPFWFRIRVDYASGPSTYSNVVKVGGVPGS
jgi:hypothetical protein